MATSNGSLIQALIDGGVAPPAARVIASALANAATPQFSQSRDVSDQTPIEELRLVTGDARKYQFPNLDYSSEEPYERTLRANPGQYVSGYSDHPYKDSQPVLPVAPLSKSRITGGEFISVDNSVEENAPLATVGLKVSKKSGVHVRLNQATNSIEAVPLEFDSPQGLVTATVAESGSATSVELAVQSLRTATIILADGSTARIRYWGDGSSSPPAQVLTPTGAILPFAYQPASLSGWLLCDGSTYSRTMYAALFAAIGTSYGVGDGSTTFAVPDLRGYFVRGSGTNSDGTAAGTLGAKQADTTKRPTTALTGTTDTTGAHTHTYTFRTGTAVQSGTNTACWIGTTTANTGSSGDHSHVVTIDGGGDAETRPKNIALPYYIKT
jgi:microcystin-dependent protein